MTKRRRAYSIDNFDYYGIVAQEAQYEDGFDEWCDMVSAFKDIDKVPIKRSHGDVRFVGNTKKWDLDDKNKNITIYFNKEDLNKDVEFDELNQVSVEWEVDKNGKIIGINHICIGNTFQQKCDKQVCNIVKQRGDEPPAETDSVDEPDEVEEPEVPEETSESDVEEISNKVLVEEIELLKKQIEELSKVKDEPEPEPEGEEDEEEEQEEKIKLGFQDKLKHDLPTDKNEPKTGFTKWKFI